MYSNSIAQLKALDAQRERHIADIAWAEWVKTGRFPPRPRRRRALWFWAD